MVISPSFDIIQKNKPEYNKSIYAFMRYDPINSNPFSLSTTSPLFDERLTAGWPIFNILAVSTMLIPSFIRQ